MDEIPKLIDDRIGGRMITDDQQSSIARQNVSTSQVHINEDTIEARPLRTKEKRKKYRKENAIRRISNDKQTHWADWAKAS